MIVSVTHTWRLCAFYTAFPLQVVPQYTLSIPQWGYPAPTPIWVADILINTGKQESWLLIGDRNLRKADAVYYCLLLCYKTDNTAALYTTTTALMREKVAVFNEKSSEVY